MDPSAHNRPNAFPPDRVDPGREELARYRSEFAAVAEDVRRLISSLEAESLNRRPAPGRWSAGECIDHLIVIGDLLIPRIEAAIASGTEKGLTGTGPFRYSWPARMFVESLQPDSRIRMKTIPLYVPAETHDPGDLLRRFGALQERLIQSTIGAEGLDLIRVKVASPANRLLRFGVGTWFAATVAHQRRHYAQANRSLTPTSKAPSA